MENHLEPKQKNTIETLSDCRLDSYIFAENKKVLVAPPKDSNELKTYVSWLVKEGFFPQVLHENSKIISAPLILCGGAGIGKNPKRDELEFKWIEMAISEGQPIIGICKGMQMLTHYFGGTVENLDETLIKSHSSDDFSKKSHKHEVMDLDGTTMIVNSIHHQYCSKIPNNFRVRHVSIGGGYIPESIEDCTNKIWAVQWHPEKYEMENNTYPLCKLSTK